MRTVLLGKLSAGAEGHWPQESWGHNAQHRHGPDRPVSSASKAAPVTRLIVLRNPEEARRGFGDLRDVVEALPPVRAFDGD